MARIAIVGLALTLCTSSFARPLREALVVNPPSCLEASAVAAQVATWLKTDDLDSRLRIVIDGDTASIVEFRVERGGEVVGRRAFDTKGITCPNVTALISLAIAMAIDAVSLPPPPLATHAPTSTRTPGIGARAHVTAGVETGLLVGVLPHPALAAAIALGVSFDNFSLRASGLASAIAGDTLGPGRVDTSLAEAELGVCLALPTTAVLWRGCAGIALGRVSATGSGFEQSTTVSFGWFAGTLRVDALIRVSKAFRVVVFVEPIIPLPNPIEVDVQRGSSITASRTFPAVGVALGLGPVLQLP